MRKISLLLIVVFSALLLGGCGPSSADILEQYKDYSAVDSSSNKAGISIGKVELTGNSYIISVFISHPAINQSTENAGVIANRLRAVDAEKPDVDLDFQIYSVDSTTTMADGTRTQEYYPAIYIPKDIKARYVIIYCEGISEDESPELETPPMFFIVELDKKDPKVLTDNPLLADKLFN